MAHHRHPSSSSRLTPTALTLAIGLVVLASACDKKEPAAPPAPQIVMSIPETDIRAERTASLQLAPPNPAPNAEVVAKAELTNVPAGTRVTLSWFGPDGWLVWDESRDAGSGPLEWRVPAGRLQDRGRYTVDLHTDHVQLAVKTVDIAG